MSSEGHSPSVEANRFLLYDGVALFYHISLHESISVLSFSDILGMKLSATLFTPQSPVHLFLQEISLTPVST